MAMDAMESAANGQDNGRDTLFMMSGVALIVFGTGLLLSNPFVRRYMSQMGIGNFAQAVMPDFERYFKLRAM
jgi:uncharacterized membrane protein HdeD (DUF308 family)